MDNETIEKLLKARSGLADVLNAYYDKKFIFDNVAFAIRAIDATLPEKAIGG